MLAMRRSRIFVPALAGSALVLVLAASAQTPPDMKATAPEKMMPSGKAELMRACDKLAMEQHVKMEDRTAFVTKCIADKAKAK
jgi:hypothetical protein